MGGKGWGEADHWPNAKQIALKETALPSSTSWTRGGANKALQSCVKRGADRCDGMVGTNCLSPGGWKRERKLQAAQLAGGQGCVPEVALR